MTSWFTNRRGSRPFTILIIVGGLYIILNMPLIKMQTTDLSVHLVANHPEIAGAEKTNLEITSELENILLSLPEVRSIKSRTTAGSASISIDLYPGSIVEKFIANLNRTIRLRATRFPPGFNLPNITENTKSAHLYVREITLSVMDSLHTKHPGVLPQPPDYPALVHINAYRSYLQRASEIDAEFNLGGEKISAADSGWTADSINRSRSDLFHVRPVHNTPALIRNGLSYQAISLSGKQADPTLINPTRLYDLPTLQFYLAALLLFMVGACITLRCSKVDVRLIIISSAACIILYMFQNGQYNRSALLMLLIVLPLFFIAKPGARKPFRPVLLGGFFLICVCGWRLGEFDFTPVEYVPETTTNHSLEALMVLDPAASERDLRNYRLFVCRALDKFGILYEIEISGSTQFQLKLKDTPVSRQILSTIALNSAGSSWFIGAGNETILSTFNSPVYPAIQWTIAGQDLESLRSAASWIKQWLGAQQNVLHVRDLSSVPAYFQLPTHSYQIRSDMASSAFESQLKWLRPGPRGNFDGLIEMDVPTRLENLLQPSPPNQTEILKKDRRYYMQIGCEFAGSARAENRFRKKFKRMVQEHFDGTISVNPWQISPDKITADLTYTTGVILVLSLLISSFRSRGIEDMAHQFIVIGSFVLAHIYLDIPIWKPVYLIVLIALMNYLLNLCLRCRLMYSVTWLGLLLVLSFFLQITSLQIGVSVLVGGNMLTRPVPKLTLTGPVLLLLFRDRQFFQKN